MSNSRSGVKEIVKIDRGIRIGGGKMRPVEKPIWICLLSCGHTVERRKSQSKAPPKKAQCVQCLEALDQTG